MDNAVKHMNEAWRKAIMREARELVGRRHRHVWGCPVCFDLLDSDGCEALEGARSRGERHRDPATGAREDRP
jgi:hypothetical protein